MNKRLIKIIAIILTLMALLFGISWAIYSYVTTSADSSKEVVTITNLDEVSKGKPRYDDVITRIQSELLTAVNKNVQPAVTADSIKDAVVRDGTFQQSYDEKTTVNSVHFIVDIASLKQSYDVSYQWQDDKKWSTNLDEWGTVVKCPSKETLLYGDFNCKDMFTEMTAGRDANLDTVLPYKTDYYTIDYYKEDGKIVLSIRIVSSYNSERTKKRFLQYKADAMQWLKDHAIEPSRYYIVCRDTFNNQVSVEAPTQ